MIKTPFVLSSEDSAEHMMRTMEDHSEVDSDRNHYRL